MKNLLIIYPSMNTGGIETLILRFATYYKANGKTLKVMLTTGGGQLSNDLNKIAEVKTKDYNLFGITEKKITDDPFFESVEEIFAMFPDENRIGLKIASILSVPYKVGIYHPEDYGKLTNIFYRKLFDLIPDHCKLFMNRDCLSSHEVIYGRKIQAEIWQLPVIFETTDKEPEAIIQQKNKIISIGRFDPFKTYNLTMIDVIKRFKDKGIDLVYELYGYGLLENKMQDLIKKNNLGDRVFIKGILKYNELRKTVKTAHLFVGCGTAAIEASYAGVPTIISAIGTDNISNGFFADDIGFNVGEESTSLKTYLIDELIEKVLAIDENAYNTLCLNHTKVAKERYEVNAVFEKYFKLPEIKVNLNATLKFNIFMAFIYHDLHKFYKVCTKKTGLQKLKQTVKSIIKK